jgi:hypothetical protein
MSEPLLSEGFLNPALCDPQHGGAIGIDRNIGRMGGG